MTMIDIFTHFNLYHLKTVIAFHRLSLYKVFSVLMQSLT